MPVSAANSTQGSDLARSTTHLWLTTSNDQIYTGVNWRQPSAQVQRKAWRFLNHSATALLAHIGTLLPIWVCRMKHSLPLWFQLVWEAIKTSHAFLRCGGIAHQPKLYVCVETSKETAGWNRRLLYIWVFLVIIYCTPPDLLSGTNRKWKKHSCKTNVEPIAESSLISNKMRPKQVEQRPFYSFHSVMKWRKNRGKQEEEEMMARESKGSEWSKGRENWRIRRQRMNWKQRRTRSMWKVEEEWERKA